MINIGVTQRQVKLNGRDKYDALEATLFEYFLDLGINLIPIPNIFGHNSRHENFKFWAKHLKIKGFLLSGGDNPEVIDERYLLEEKILRTARLENLPIFGICRGLERMILHEGGSLIKCFNHVNIEINIEGEIWGKVRCFHNLTIEELPLIFRITSLSQDNLIESVAHVNLPWEGCMWHPERSTSRNLLLDDRILKLFHD